MLKFKLPPFIVLLSVLLLTTYHAKSQQVDPIQFKVSTNATNVSLNEEFEITITARYMNLSPTTSYMLKDANYFKVKLIMPDGFERTGGSYHDFIGTELSPSRPEAKYTLKGRFTSESSTGNFELLRGHKSADNGSTLIAVGKLSFNRIDPVTNGDEKAQMRVAVVGFVPYMTIAELQSGAAGDARAVMITNNPRQGLYVYDSTDTSTPQHVALVILAGTKRFKRVVDGLRYMPEWWGCLGDGVTNDKANLQTAFDYLNNIRGSELILSRTYLVVDQLLIKSHVSGFGTIRARKTGNYSLYIQRDSLTIRDITIDGMHEGVPNGRALYSQVADFLTIQNVKIRNVVAAGIALENSKNTKINGCFINNTVGDIGDGIYMLNAVNPQITNNHISNFQRVGIVCEGEPGNYTTNAIIIGNTCVDAIETKKPVDYPNAGIWGEEVQGITISNNVVKNTFARGIVVTPNIASPSTAGNQYDYIVTGNQIENVAGTGIAFSGAYGQRGIFTSNSLTDCVRGFSAGWSKEVICTDNQFNVRNLPADSTDYIIQYIPWHQSGQHGNLLIANCRNNINNSIRPAMSIAASYGITGSLTIRDCEGNFGFTFPNNVLNGNISVSNTLLDLSSISGDGRFWVVANGKFSLDNCDVILPPYTLNMFAHEFESNNSRISGPTAGATKLNLYQTGGRVVRITNSQFKNVVFYDLRRTNHEFYLKGSTFDGYSNTEGLFETTPYAFAKLEVDGCVFSKTQAIEPIRLSVQPAEFLEGSNYYASASLSNRVPTLKYRNITRASATARPTTYQQGMSIFDTTISREITYNGSEWTGAPSVISNPATSEPTKAALNSTYGAYMQGTKVIYKDVTTGSCEFEKISNSNTGDWVKTKWSDGVKTMVP